MQAKKTQNVLSGMVILSEVSHVFCCVLPTIFSIASVLAAFGLIGITPVWMDSLHNAMHSYEIPIIISSGVILALGWLVHYYSQKLDCHDDGCCHPPCEPKKDRAHTVLKIGTVLFLFNVAIFLIFHKGLETLGVVQHNPAAIEHAHSHDHAHAHDH